MEDRSALSGSGSRLTLAWGLGTAGVLSIAYWAGINGTFGDGATIFVSDLGLAGAALLAAGASGRAAMRAVGRTKIAWLLMAVALLWWFAGEAIWSFYELALGRDAPFPSPADVAYLGAIPLAAAALLFFPSAPSHAASRWRTVLDAVLVTVSALLISWTTVLRALFDDSGEGLVERAIVLAYPLGDAVIVALVVLVMLRRHSRRWVPFALLGGGLVSLAVADTGYLYLELQAAYRSGHPIDVGWFVGYLLLGLAALNGAGDDPTDGPGEPSRWQSFVPYIVVAPALALGVSTQIELATGRVFSFAVLMVIVAFVVARQFTVVLENRTLTIERLRSLDEMRNSFLVAVSHEFRTPMTSLFGFIETLRRDDLPEGSRRDILDRLAANAAKLNRLLSDLLDVDRLTRGTLVPRPQAVDLRTVTSTALERIDLGHRHVTLEADEAPAHIDPAFLERIIETLAVNVAKHTPPQTRAWVRCRRRDGCVILAVDDDGPGIPDPLKTDVFRPFTQADKPEHAPGVGIGLSLVAGLAAAHGGRAWVEDRDGGGASFRVTLPELEGIDRGAADASWPRAFAFDEPREFRQTDAPAPAVRPEL